MTAIEIRNQKLHTTQRLVPVADRGEVLVKVHAAGVNRPDLLQVAGRYPPPPGITDIPGLEIAGTVIKGAGRIQKGQKICALVAGGGYAQYCAVPVRQCLPLPRGFNFSQGAALPETFFTVWRNLFDIAKFKSGESVLVHGGTSGIGVAAIQIAKSSGAYVVTTAGSPRKCDAAKQLGADIAINYKKQDFVKAVLQETDQRGVDIVLDMVGGDYIARNLQCLADGGRHISIAVQNGHTGEIDIFRIMRKRLSLTGSVLRSRPGAEKAAIAQKLHKHIWPLLDNRAIRPVIDKVFALHEAQKAHDYMRKGRHIGKIILQLND